MLSADLIVSSGYVQPRPGYGVSFGGYERLRDNAAACAWGTVTVKAIDVESGGITREGACLPTAGGH
jgi:hypothetical protein